MGHLHDMAKPLQEGSEDAVFAAMMNVSNTFIALWDSSKTGDILKQGSHMPEITMETSDVVITAYACEWTRRFVAMDQREWYAREGG